MKSAKIPLLLTACILPLYAAFPTRTYYWDGVLFALYIERVQKHELPLSTLFHANHLIYTVAGYVLYQASLLTGLSWRAITVLQAANVVLSCGCAAMIYRLAERITASVRVAILITILFAFGATWWKFSTDADAYIPAVFLLLLAMWFALRHRPSFLLAGACHASAMLFHEIAVFAYVPLLTAVALQPISPRARLLKGCLYVVSTGGIVFAAYELCYAQIDHFAHPTLLSWVTSYASNTPLTRSVADVAVKYLASYRKLFAGGRFGLIRQFLGITMWTAAVACLICCAGAVRSFRKPETEAKAGVDRKALLVLWAWLLPSAVFLAMFDPASAFHKLFVWPPIVLLCGAYIASRPKLFARTYGFTFLAAALAMWNFGMFIWPHSHADADPVLKLALRIDKQLPLNSTVYYADFNSDDWFLDYFAPRRNWTPLPAGEPGPGCFDTTALQRLGARVRVDPNKNWQLVDSAHNVRLACSVSASR